VKVFALPDRSQSQGVGLGQAIAVDGFRVQNPHIRLERSTQLQVEGHSMDAGVLMAIAGGISPDIIYVNFRQSESYIQQGFLHPLDEYMSIELTTAEAKARGVWKPEIMYRDEYEERVPEPVRPVIRRKGPPDGKEHFYAMPYTLVVSTMIYRKDLFAEAGLDPESPPRTWDEFFDYALKLTNPEKGVYGVGYSEGPEMSYYLYPFLCSSGAKAVTLQPNGEWRATFDTPDAVEAYFFFNKLLNHPWDYKGKKRRGVAYIGTDIWQKWAEGKIAMMANNYLADNQLTTYNTELYGFAPVPKGPTGISSAEINCLMMGIFAGVKDKSVRDAAWAYLRYIDGPEARRIITRTLVESGNAKLVNPVYLERYGFRELVPLAPKGLNEIYSFALKHGTPEPYGKNCQLVYDYLTKPLDKIRFSNFDGKSEKDVKAEIHAILKQSVEEANEKMIGYIPPAKKRTRNLVAWAAVLLVVTSFVLIFRRILSAFSGMGGPDVQWGFAKYRAAYLVLLPALLLILVWQYYPLARGSLMAFQDYMIVGGSRWVGLENFANVMFDGQYWRAFWISLYFMVLWIGLGFFPPIFLAILLQEVPRCKVVFRTLFYLPAVISAVVVMFLWKQFYDPSEFGLLNRIIHFFGMSPQRWLGDPKLAMVCILIPLAWASIGPGCIIYLAALKSIPEELYEAAEIDGAGFRRKIFSIVLPFLRPLLVINFVGAFIAAFKSVDFVLAMTGGGPGGATRVVGMEIFEKSFLFLKFGTATAMAWILGSMLLGFTALQLRTLSRVEFRTAKA
jgi:multiple sugar transport system permease protein